MSLSFAIAELETGYARGLRAEDVIAEVLRRIGNYSDDAVWISRFEADTLLNKARTLDALSREEKALLPLFGIPFAVKDNIDCAGLPTTAACPAFSYSPAHSAEAVQSLIDAGAIPIGKTNLDQFATGLVGTRSPYGAPRSVFNKDYISGGSSSGSAVAVAAGLVSFSLGTDTAGSGRVPASFNNIVGLKASRGLLSTQGVVPACHSFDCVSIFALDIDDARKVFDVAATRATVGERKKDFTFAVPRRQDLQFFGDKDAERLFAEAVSRLEALGGACREIDYAPFAETAALLYGPFVAERFEAVGAFIEANRDIVDPVVRDIILGGKNKQGDVAVARVRLEALKLKVAKLLASVDVMLVPTTPTIYRVEEIAADPVSLNSRLGTYTNFMNLLDLCGLALPAGVGGNGLPYGVTLVAPAHQEATLFDIGCRFERALGLKPGGPQIMAKDWIEIAVVGAHMTGLPLNHELTSRGAQFVERTTTMPAYKFYALPGGPPFRPGLARVCEGGAEIELEIWRLPALHWGSFMAGVPQPLCIGTLDIAGERKVKGFLCETTALGEATDITAYGGWRAFLAAKAKAAS